MNLAFHFSHINQSFITIISPFRGKYGLLPIVVECDVNGLDQANVGPMRAKQNLFEWKLPCEHQHRIISLYSSVSCAQFMNKM